MTSTRLLIAAAVLFGTPLAARSQIAIPAQRTPAQDAAAALGRDVSNEQIARALRQSGLSEAQIRERLKAGGYDPALADPYFATQQTNGAPTEISPAKSAAFAQALETVGLLTHESLTTGSLTPATRTPVPPTDTARALAAKRTAHSKVFGKDIFDRTSTAFDPVTSGPVDPSYRLGIGDQLQVVVTGQVEIAYQLEIRRDGTVIIPQVGQIGLAGLTLDAARAALRSRMGKSYSGLGSGEARLDLSISRLRSNAVFVIGDAENPGAYQVNALSTVFHALARAGGPSERGSFREIELRRGGKVIQRLDVYDYLLKGDAAGDIRLEQGDVVFVPLSRRVVEVSGAVRRPRIFELRDSEGFNDLLNFAGGLLPSASVERVQVDRILPPDQRSPGVDRVKVDVSLRGNLDSLSRVKLLDGDSVSVFVVGDLRRNVVTITGEVNQPGDFQLLPKATLGKLVDRAQGLQPWALADRVKVIRQDRSTGKSELHAVDLTNAAGQAFELAEFDSIEVLDARLAFARDSVFVEGAVNLPMPQARSYAARETLRDAIQRAGGFREGASTVDVFRRKRGAAYSDTTSIAFRFPVTASFDADPAAGGFALERDDHIVVHLAPGYRRQQFVVVAGQFKHTGSYAIAENQDRVRDVVVRAGEPLTGGYPESFRLVRDGKRVSVDFVRAMRSDPTQNIPLLGGDSLVIDRDPHTVFVAGAVGRPSLIRFRSGLSVQDYIELAGGPAERGQANKAVIEYPSGFSKRVKRVALFFHTSPDVVSGTTIFVPEKPDDKGNSADIWARVLGTASALTSVIIAIVAVRKM